MMIGISGVKVKKTCGKGLFQLKKIRFPAFLIPFPAFFKLLKTYFCLVI